MNKFFEEELPRVGLDMMRLPKSDGKYGRETDTEKVIQVVDLFMEKGFNYFDTAFIYDNGKSEEALKKAVVSRYPRDKFFVASKLCAFMGCKDEKSAKKQFEQSLKRTGAGYFDFYLLHMIRPSNYMNWENYKLWDYIRLQKDKGLIGHWGFSCSGDAEFLEKILNDHPDAEFVQLQISYADWDDPVVRARECYEAAVKHGKPVIAAEPQKGGSLAMPVKAVSYALAEAGSTPSALALRFAAELENTVVTLAEISEPEQAAADLKALGEVSPLNADEKSILQRASAAYAKAGITPCTSCKFCEMGCPMNIPIPEIFSITNGVLLDGDKEKAKKYYNGAVSAPKRSKASECLHCGKCDLVCPQSIHIVKALMDVKSEFEL